MTKINENECQMAISRVESGKNQKDIKKRFDSLCFYPCFSKIDHGTLLPNHHYSIVERKESLRSGKKAF